MSASPTTRRPTAVSAARFEALRLEVRDVSGQLGAGPRTVQQALAVKREAAETLDGAWSAGFWLTALCHEVSVHRALVGALADTPVLDLTPGQIEALVDAGLGMGDVLERIERHAEQLDDVVRADLLLRLANNNPSLFTLLVAAEPTEEAEAAHA